MQTMDVNKHIELNLVHSIHNSERMSKRGCPRRHSWIYHDGYYPTVTPKPLEFGVAFHVAMETYYNPATWFDKQTAAALATVAFVNTCKEQYKTFCKNNPELVTPETAADYAEREELGKGMLRHYFKWESPEHDSNLTPMKVEISFEVPIEGPNGETIWCKCDRCWRKWQHSEVGIKHHDEWQESLSAEDFEVGKNEKTYREVIWDGLPVTFGGRIDCLVKDNYGRYWLVDWKTAAKLSTGEPGADDDYLWLDDQITGYCWALRRIGIPIAGFIYAEIKKAIPEEPEPLKVVRKGRMFSVNQQINTTYEMYRKTVAELDSAAYEGGHYDDFLEFLKGPKGPKFHLRHQMHRTDHELDVAGLELYEEALDVTQGTRRYRTPGRFTCGNCAYKDPCVSRNRGEDYLYTLETMFEKRTKHYYEEAKPSTEKEGRS